MFKIKDPITKFKISALISGMAGSYVSILWKCLISGMPTSLLIYASIWQSCQSTNFEGAYYRERIHINYVIANI
jgi:ABC-type uncharacterized transport system YnjBCD permease subunit